MDEYIKRSEVIDLVEKAIKKCSTEKTTKGVLVCAHLRTAVMGLRSADVAPRAEVAREIFEEIDKRFEALLGFYPCNGEFEDAKGFVDFHWKYIKRSIMRDYDPDFEKKYTEPEPPEGE